MTWSAISAGQEAVDAQSTSAQQLAWATKSISNKAGAAEVVGNLERYLSVAVEQDPQFLATGDTAALLPFRGSIKVNMEPLAEVSSSLAGKPFNN
jgi:hypothetical protein